MAALDFSPNAAAPITRMDAVKAVIREFVEKRPNDRIGMITFASNPFIVSPMTLNHDWLRKNFERVDIGVIDADSTAIGTALAMSVNRLKELKNAKSRVVILLTDGENNAGQITPVAAAEAAASFNAKVYTIAVGRSGIVPAARLDENQRVIRDAYGRPVYAGDMRSSVDESTLRKISEITGGKFYRAENMAEPAQYILRHRRARKDDRKAAQLHFVRRALPVVRGRRARRARVKTAARKHKIQDFAMTFHSPIWLYAALAAAAVLAFAALRARAARRKALAKFASQRLMPELTRTVSAPKIIVKNALVFCAVMLIFAALARPQWGYRWEETKTRGIDIIFAVDTSKSMLAEDVKPDRLERAKLSVLDLVNILQGDRIGIVAFSGQAFLQCPLTLDYDAFRMSLEALDTNVIQRGGTNISAGDRRGGNRLFIDVQPQDNSAHQRRRGA